MTTQIRTLLSIPHRIALSITVRPSVARKFIWCLSRHYSRRPVTNFVPQPYLHTSYFLTVPPIRHRILFSTRRSTSMPSNDAIETGDMSNKALNANSSANGDSRLLRYIDIGINLTDPVFHGLYHSKQAHPDDLAHIISRAQSAGVQKFMVTGSDLEESRRAVSLAAQYSGLCYATVGVHPCSAHTLDSYKPGGAHALLTALKDLAVAANAAGHAVAFGEIGLDYDRLFLCPRDAQLRAFEAQLDIAVELQLPLFLHSRAAAEDFEALLRPRLNRLPRKGLVHSFTGTVDEMRALVALGLDIGVNGCSLKTEENLSVVKEIPLERLQLETDGPWCEIRPSHAGWKFLQDEGAPKGPKAVKKEKWVEGAMVKGRNEPCMLPAVAWIVARTKGLDVSVVADAAWKNSEKMFGLGLGKSEGNHDDQGVKTAER